MTIDGSNAQEMGVHQWYADASAIGIKPGGEYPAAIETTLGNGRPFVFRHFDGNWTATYWQELGCLTLKVWND